MNKQLTAMLVMLIVVSGPTQATDVTANVELFDWNISLIRSDEIEVKQGLCGTSPCSLADNTSIVLAITRAFGVWSKK